MCGSKMYLAEIPPSSAAWLGTFIASGNHTPASQDWRKLKWKVRPGLLGACRAIPGQSGSPIIRPTPGIYDPSTPFALASRSPFYPVLKSLGQRVTRRLPHFPDPDQGIMVPQEVEGGEVPGPRMGAYLDRDKGQSRGLGSMPRNERVTSHERPLFSNSWCRGASHQLGLVAPGDTNLISR